MTPATSRVLLIPLRHIPPCAHRVLPFRPGASFFHMAARRPHLREHFLLVPRAALAAELGRSGLGCCS